MTERAAMLDRLEERAVAHGHQEIVVTLAAWRDVVRPAIEREAAQQERERIRAALNKPENLLTSFNAPTPEGFIKAYTKEAIDAILAEPSDE